MKRALIVVDVQNDFCEGGSLAVAGGAAVAAEITKWIEKHRKDYEVVVATKDFHEDPGDHFAAEGTKPNFSTTWPAHCVVNTVGAELHPHFKTDLVDEIFRKGLNEAAYSGFEGRNLEGKNLYEYLNAHDIGAVDVVGIATDYCVKATALDAAIAGLETRVILDLTVAVAEATRATTCEELAKNEVQLAHVWEFEPCRYCKNEGLGFQ